MGNWLHLVPVDHRPCGPVFESVRASVCMIVCEVISGGEGGFTSKTSSRTPCLPREDREDFNIGC